MALNKFWPFYQAFKKSVILSQKCFKVTASKAIV